MVLAPIEIPENDPTSIFELFRGSYGSELLVAATAHLKVFDMLGEGPKTLPGLQEALGLEERPTYVLLTALRAFGLLKVNIKGEIGLTDLANEHLVSGRAFDVSNYLGLAAESPGVLEMVQRLKTNKPAGTGEGEEGEGAAYIYRDGVESKMEETAQARFLTLALSGRAKNVAPVLANNYPIPEAKTLLDVGAGSGIYSIAYLQKHPELKVIIFDRPEVLKVAEEFAEAYDLAARIEFVEGDVFKDELPKADVVLLSNVLHDWDIPECNLIVKNCAKALNEGGELLIHDVFLNDALDGPLPIALYSAALFTLTEGRAYAPHEYRDMLSKAGLKGGEVVPTSIHCGVLPARQAD